MGVRATREPFHDLVTKEVIISGNAPLFTRGTAKSERVAGWGAALPGEGGGVGTPLGMGRGTTPS